MMHVTRCEDVQERLEEFHDDELTIEQRVAIQSHLQDCVTCSLVAAELADLRHSLREAAWHQPDRDAPEAERLPGYVVERLRVEEQFSFESEIKSLFQDMPGFTSSMDIWRVCAPGLPARRRTARARAMGATKRYMRMRTGKSRRRSLFNTTRCVTVSTFACALESVCPPATLPRPSRPASARVCLRVGGIGAHTKRLPSVRVN